jgi:DNA-binding CsgD family transcriptional regulator
MLLRGDGAYPRRLSFIALGEVRHSTPSVNEPAYALVLHDPNVTPKLDTNRAQELFGLTPAEAKLAAKILEGNSLSECAELLDISPHTARAQLRSVFMKTNTSRQSELLSLILRSCSIV